MLSLYRKVIKNIIRLGNKKVTLHQSLKVPLEIFQDTGLTTELVENMLAKQKLRETNE